LQLNALLGLPLDAPMTLSTPLDDAPGLVSVTLIERAQASNPELAVLDRRIEEQILRVALARAMRTPDLIPEATLTRGAEPEFTTGWRAALGVTLPLLTSHRAGVLLEESTLAQLRRARDATVARITGEVAAAIAQVDAQRQQYLRYRDEILPQALEVERLAEDSYRLGQTGIAALLQALQASRDVRLQSLQVASQFQGTLADLERSIGTPIP
jgi:cobalt-zinc-cadmium efflux system outer membrane protein